MNITTLHEMFKPKTIKWKIASIRVFYHYLEEEDKEFQNLFRRIKVKFKETIRLSKIIPRNEIIIKLFISEIKEKSSKKLYSNCRWKYFRTVKKAFLY